ncbi:uncharacterized protein KNAG_0J01140 [Huiozyma naganishii CBS 8797]|uniref:Retroviral polymerase SH3-like domain-containing protein n=1 Tax=Huiozyma naganishii (strain ATCC MYA-139 / BCRC 22969 / CBS 8797 / KCTC 17520 / NBRC 10181 / NCYC 3082 / Yp74L-3) TaxID=1071383 RepID=J7SAI4_HUIN7|nr:hypothetical protein KNAG_0J01140 [Kazachstania naganishii CBS 8797]CCK72196.1 hypothetical protein KNAG_0J01140 [Kazachstania naganishii CBS 8797]
MCAAYLVNRLPVMHKNGIIPFAKYHTDNTEVLSHKNLRTFGCAAYASAPKVNRDGKLAPTTISGVMVGYAENWKAYRIYHPQDNKTHESNQVSFDETVFPLWNPVASHNAYDSATSATKDIPHYVPSGGRDAATMSPVSFRPLDLNKGVTATGPEVKAPVTISKSMEATSDTKEVAMLDVQSNASEKRVLKPQQAPMGDYGGILREIQQTQQTQQALLESIMNGEVRLLAPDTAGGDFTV